MQDLLERLVLDPAADWTIRQAVSAALEHFYLFTLVLVRMSGLMSIGPLFGQSVVPINIRVLLVLVMSLLITPTLGAHSHVAWQRIDANGDGRVIRAEVPPTLLARFDRIAGQAAVDGRKSLSEAEFFAPLRAPQSLFEFAYAAVAELSLGLVLGLGVLTILSGLQIAGELIDQQTGIGLGDVFNPALDSEGSLTGQMLFTLGLTLFLILDPVSGHLLMVSALVETFQALPVGEAFVSVETVDLLRDLVHQSAVLSVQVAAPILAAMSLVSLTMGFLGHTVPQINVLVIGFPVRASINLLILALSLSGIARTVVDALPATIDGLRDVLMSMG